MRRNRVDTQPKKGRGSKRRPALPYRDRFGRFARRGRAASPRPYRDRFGRFSRRGVKNKPAPRRDARGRFIRDPRIAPPLPPLQPSLARYLDNFFSDYDLTQRNPSPKSERRPFLLPGETLEEVVEYLKTRGTYIDPEILFAYHSKDGFRNIQAVGTYALIHSPRSGDSVLYLPMRRPKFLTWQQWSEFMRSTDPDTGYRGIIEHYVLVNMNEKQNEDYKFIGLIFWAKEGIPAPRSHHAVSIEDTAASEMEDNEIEEGA